MADSEPSDADAGAPATAKGTKERRELGRRAQSVARRAAESKATIPHLYVSRRIETGATESTGIVALIVAAAATALRRHPGLNCAYRDGGIEHYSRINVGFTVETPEGALVPTLFDADKMTMERIETEIAELSGRANAGSLASPQLSGGTFSVTALTEGGDSLAVPVIPGQCGHLGIGRPRPAAVADGEELRVSNVVDLTLSCDQRAVRPPQAAAFLDALAAAEAQRRVP